MSNPHSCMDIKSPVAVAVKVTHESCLGGGRIIYKLFYGYVSLELFYVLRIDEIQMVVSKGTVAPESHSIHAVRDLLPHKFQGGIAPLCAVDQSRGVKVIV